MLKVGITAGYVTLRKRDKTRTRTTMVGHKVNQVIKLVFVLLMNLNLVDVGEKLKQIKIK